MGFSYDGSIDVTIASGGARITLTYNDHNAKRSTVGVLLNIGFACHAEVNVWDEVCNTALDCIQRIPQQVGDRSTLLLLLNKIVIPDKYRICAIAVNFDLVRLLKPGPVPVATPYRFARVRGAGLWKDCVCIHLTGHC